MPFVRVSWLQGRDRNTKTEIAAEITRSIARHGGIEPEAVYVVFEDTAPGNWAVGGKLLDEDVVHGMS